MKLHKGDKVLVIAGKDKGREGKIEKVFPKRSKVLIPGINMYKRHMRKTQQQEGGIIEFAKPLPVSNVALICSECGKHTRIGYTIVNGEKQRVCRKCEAIIK